MTGGEYYRATVAEVRARGNYFKAVRPDGYSFMGSPKKLYAIGKTTVADGDGTTLCRKGALHISDAPSETLAGGEWPCRLFEVSGEIIAGFNDAHPHKGGAKSLRVVRELPVWMSLGPNGRAAAAFIELLPTLDVAALDAVRYAALDVVRYAALDAAWNAALDAVRYAVRHAAWNAAWNAARAIVVSDLITPDQFATLYKPFADVLPIERVREHGIAMFPTEAQP